MVAEKIPDDKRLRANSRWTLCSRKAVNSNVTDTAFKRGKRAEFGNGPHVATRQQLPPGRLGCGLQKGSRGGTNNKHCCNNTSTPWNWEKGEGVQPNLHQARMYICIYVVVIYCGRTTNDKDPELLQTVAEESSMSPGIMEGKPPTTCVPDRSVWHHVDQAEIEK